MHEIPLSSASRSSHMSRQCTRFPIYYGADLGHFFTKIGLLKSVFLETVRAPIIISHVALFIPFHISHHIVKMTFTSYVSAIISSTTLDRNAFRSHVAGLP
jgi:hypothetical protein